MTPIDDAFDFFRPDEHRLDQEWLEQPRLFGKHALQLADARREHEETKAERDVIVAEIDMDIRRDPVKYDLPKVTEGSVEKLILLQPRYQKAQRKVIEAKHRVDVLQAVCDALEHRKKALENLVHLHGQDYFSTPTPPKGTREAVEENAKREVRRRTKIK